MHIQAIRLPSTEGRAFKVKRNEQLSFEQLEKKMDVNVVLGARAAFQKFGSLINWISNNVL